MKRLSLYLIILSIPLFSASGFRKICDSPKVYECEHFITHKECDKIIEGARPLLARSTVVDLNSSEGIIDPRRSSFGMFFSGSTEGKAVGKIRKEIASFARIPVENGEDMQVLHYPVGGEYQPHYDYFDPSTPGGLIHFNRGGQRVATLLVYLNTVAKGGETIFPKANLAIAPTKGKAVLFYNVKPDGRIDPRSFHGGAPVLAGEKWIATIWLRERRFE